MSLLHLPGVLGLTHVSSSIPSTTDVHTVASLLKLYLRELPEPVIPFARYEDFLSCAQLLTKDEGEVSASWGPILGGGLVGGGHVEPGHKFLDFSVARGSWPEDCCLCEWVAGASCCLCSTLPLCRHK